MIDSEPRGTQQLRAWQIETEQVATVIRHANILTTIGLLVQWLDLEATAPAMPLWATAGP
jgi:hypothetical protein